MLRSLDGWVQAMRFRLHHVRRSLLDTHEEMHPARAGIHAQRTIGEFLADGMAAAVGSWPFVIGQTIFISAWILWNSLSGHAFDPFPWILLNLCMSTQAMYTGPVILLSSNRQAARDRLRDNTEATEVDQLYQINQQQLEILQLLRVLVGDPPQPDGAPGQPASQAALPRTPSQQASQVPQNALSGATVPPEATKGATLLPVRRKKRA